MKKTLFFIGSFSFLSSLFLFAQSPSIMKEIKTEIIIQAPQAVVWKVLTDFEAYGEWNPFIISIIGKQEVGARLVTTMNSEGKERVFKPVIKQFDGQTQFEWLGKLPLGLFTGRHYFQLQALNPGQTQLIHGEVFGGLLRGMIMKKIGEATLGSFLEMNRALKERAEQIAVID